jgi:uncharacterized protein (TIGR02147 family)
MNTSSSIEAHDEGPKEFRFFLQEELIRRCKRNPRFSLRAFARALDVEASALSKILNGKRALTRRMLHRMSEQLGLGPDQVSEFERILPNTRSGTRRAQRTEGDFRQVSVDVFNAISDWYHYAILELLTVRGFQPNAQWIARAVGISVSETNFAIERLERLGLLEQLPDGSWRAGQMTTTGSNYTAAAFRKLQKQILLQASDAVDSVPLELRDQSSMTMAVRLDRLPQAKDKIRAFRRELCAFLQEGGTHDEVYQLTISLFPASRVHEIEPGTHHHEPELRAVPERETREDLS